MTLTNIDTIQYLRHAPILRKCSVQDLSRLIPFIAERQLTQNEILFKEDDTADMLFVPVNGSFKLLSGKRCIDEVSTGFVGEEAALDMENYSLTCTAATDAVVLAIEKSALNKIKATNPFLERGLYRSFASHYIFNKELLDETKSGIDAAGTSNVSEEAPTRALIGWVMAIVLPIVVALITSHPSFEISVSIQQFLTIFSAALVLWTFDLVAAFIPAIIIIFSLLVLDVAPSSLVLSGFSSSSFFLALSIFALGAVLSDSGLTYRLVLIILKAVPQSQFSYSLTLFMIGLLLTPVLPTANGRTQLVTPLMIDMVDALQLKKTGKGATRLGFAAFSGTTFMSFLFLSSKPINFVLVGLLPSQVRERFSLPYWTLAALAAGAVAIAGYIIVSSLLFRNEEPTTLSRENLQSQLNILGPMNNTEWMALGSILVFLTGVLTASIHGVAIPWVGLLVFCFLLLGKVLLKQDIRKSIDWPFLILLASLIGLSRSIAYIGFDDWISEYLGWLGSSMRNNFSLFVLLFSAAIFGARLLLPMALIVPLFGTIFIPLAEGSGVNPWLIAFIILIISDGWFFPYQYSPKLLFTSITDAQGLFNDRLLTQGNILMNIVRVFAIFASFTYWKWLGIL
ncbi:cyclic nucleotide-binding protein [[Leptolyngbya] sp. PCC 7376]|uniref:SLC13 family permease n=1 Tax=[Leptolyngbya] sp. PCC 7376 TaxID=111781 RepID=UPI00029F4411|nr:SLC13 family permease [[Leptolyngbya] sp. PCC 7376]AFY40308.1 cyclic nucleotide-binding protein [[Leptolyngbya] sp. PCC 7376]